MQPQRLIALAALAAVCLLAPAASGAASPARHRVHVDAMLSGYRNPAKMRLAITRNGRKVYDQPVHAQLCGSQCSLAPLPPGRARLRMLKLDGTREPQVLLGLYSGGAHCCFVDEVFSWSAAAGTYVRTEHDFGDPGAMLTRLGGHERFVSADDGFAYAFTDYAHSGLPIQIWSFSATRFHPVTRAYPALIRTDAARWLDAFNHSLRNGDGLIAAWAADEDLLGHQQLVASKLAAEAKAGHLKAPSGYPSGHKFIASLQKLLTRLGYTR